MPKKNQQDLTIRNLRAQKEVNKDLKKKITVLEKQVKKLFKMLKKRAELVLMMES